MSDLECQEARRQVYAGLRVLARHGERCVLLRRERLEEDASRYAERVNAVRYGYGFDPQEVHERGMRYAARRTRRLIREADEEAERYGC